MAWSDENDWRILGKLTGDSCVSLHAMPVTLGHEYVSFIQEQNASPFVRQPEVILHIGDTRTGRGLPSGGLTCERCGSAPLSLFRRDEPGVGGECVGI